MLEIAGIGKDRLYLEWVSSAEAQRFVEIATRVTDAIKNQGKFDPAALMFQLNAVEMTLDDETVRWIVGKEVKITSQGDVYGREWDIESFESTLDSVLERIYHKNLIYLAIKEGFTSVRDVNKKTGLDLEWISRLIAEMEKTSRVSFTGMKNKIPVFAAL